MANKRTYTDAELKYIKRYYPTCNTQLIADELGWTERKVKRVAIYHGVNKKVHHSKKAPKARPYKACDDYSFKPTGKPQVIELDMVDKDRMQFHIKTGNLTNGKIKILGTTAGCYTSYDGLTPAGIDVVNLKPRPNLLQRIIGFLLRGDW